MRAWDIGGAGHRTEAMWVGSAFPYITVKYGSARHNYINHHSGGDVTGKIVRGEAVGHPQCTGSELMRGHSAATSGSAMTEQGIELTTG
jgi:hypothetical protein